MNTAITDPIEKHFKLLGTHSALIARAVRDRGLDITEENRKVLHALAGAGILVATRAGRMRLNANLRQYTDRVSRRMQAYATGVEVKEDIRRLSDLIVDYSTQTDPDDLDTIRYEIEDTCQLIREGIEHNITMFRSAIEQDFSMVKGLNARIRQNEHFLKKSAELTQILGWLNHGEITEQLSNEHLRLIEEEYEWVVRRELPRWRSQLLEVQNMLGRYLHGLRDALGKRRDFTIVARWLKRNPDCRIEAADDPAAQGFLSKVTGAPAAPSPDFLDNGCRDRFQEIFKPGELQRAFAPRREVEAGEDHRIDDSLVEDAVDLTDPIDRAFETFAATARVEAPVYAAQWFVANAADIPGFDASLGEWVEHALVWSMNGPLGFRAELTSHEVQTLAGNMLVEDVAVWKAA